MSALERSGSASASSRYRTARAAFFGVTVVIQAEDGTPNLHKLGNCSCLKKRLLSISTPDLFCKQVRMRVRIVRTVTRLPALPDTRAKQPRLNVAASPHASPCMLRIALRLIVLAL